MKNYYKINPVARQLIKDSLLLENELVDALLKKVADSSLDIFKRMNFDLAPEKDRKVDTVRLKLTDIVRSDGGVELLAKLKDYSEDNQLSDGRYSSAKDLYLNSLASIIDAIKAVKEVSGDKDKKFLEYSQAAARKMQASLDDIAKQTSQRTNESHFQLNESIFTGYRGRVRRLEQRLNELISSAEGKNSSSGYSRDWKRLFIELSQKLSAIDTTRDGTGTRDKQILETLEKDTDKYQKEFNRAIITATDREIQKIENDKELKDSYGDVVDLVNKAMDEFVKANTAQETAESDIRDSIQDREEKFNEKVFPIKIGDKDTDAKFQDSSLISNIQSALINGVPSIKRFLSARGGADGKYGRGTAAVIASIQKQSGNKDANGQVDRNLLDSILASDFVSSDSRQKIVDSLDIIKDNVVTESFVDSFDKFVSITEAEKIRLDQSSLDDDIKTYYDQFTSGQDGTSSSSSSARSSANSESLAGDVAKSLRGIGISSMEAETFLKADGSLKSKYSEDFIKAWRYAAENADDEQFSFFYDGGIYLLKNKNTSLRNPMNLPKWKVSLGDDGENYDDFVKSYDLMFSSIGFVNREKAAKVFDQYFSEVSDASETAMKNVISPLKSVINLSSYIKLEDVDRKIGKAIEIFSQTNEAKRGDRDLGVEDFVAINNILVMTAGVFTEKNGKIISVSEHIREKYLDNETINQLNDDGYFTTWNASVHGPILSLTGSASDDGGGINLMKRIPADSSVRNYYSTTLEEVFGNGIPKNDKFSKIRGKRKINVKGTMEYHVDRMNAKEFSDVPQPGINKCIEVKKEDLAE